MIYLEQQMLLDQILRGNNKGYEFLHYAYFNIFLFL